MSRESHAYYSSQSEERRRERERERERKGELFSMYRVDPELFAKLKAKQSVSGTGSDVTAKHLNAQPPVAPRTTWTMGGA